MYTGENNIPQQKLAASKKTDKWHEDCVEAFINLSDQGVSTRRDYLRSLYDYYNGIIDDGDYNYVLKPYGKTRKNFPSKMRNYPIIKPIIDLLLGEKAKRPLNFSVTVQNADSISEKENAKSQMVMRNLEQHFVNSMNAAGVNTGMASQEGLQMPEHIAQQFEDSYVDNRAIKGQGAISYIMQQQEVHDKFQKAWFHFLVSGEVYSHRGVRQKEPFYEILNPVDVDYDKDPDLEFVEDGDWALIRRYVHASTIIDHYYDELSSEQVSRLENPEHSELGTFLINSNSNSSDPNAHTNRLIEVVTVYWKARKRLGFVAYMDPETGSIEEMEVPEGFKMPLELKEQGAVLTWKWINEVREGTRIDGSVYIKLRAIANQRTSLDNPSICKLPINGRRYSDVNSSNISLVSLGISYQLNYNIYKYRLELAIAKSKDSIAQFDINMIPKKWDMDKFMYYVEGTGIAWVDYNKEGVTLSPQHQSVLDMSIKTIEQYIVLLNSIMEEWEKLAGVNSQRQGQVGAYEGKAASQQAIVQSSHITEDMFRKFGRLEQRDLQALLDYSKEAWLTGKKGMYIMPDGTTEYLDLDSMQHLESNYGIFVSNTGKDLDKLENIKALSQAMVQNGLPMSAVAEMIDSDNFTKIKSNIKKAEKAQQQLEQAQQQAQAEAAQQLEAQKQEVAMAAVENDNMNREKDRQLQIKVAMINNSDNEKAAQFNLQKAMREFDIKEKELELKERELGEKANASRNSESLQKADQAIKKEDLKAKRVQKAKPSTS